MNHLYFSDDIPFNAMPSPTLTPQDFVYRWRGSTLTERSACQQHFADLCKLVRHPTPAEVDQTGESYTFEAGVQKQKGGQGWADVWKRGYFGWECKGKHKDLTKAYQQLLDYREAPTLPVLRHFPFRGLQDESQ